MLTAPHPAQSKGEEGMVSALRGEEGMKHRAKEQGAFTAFISLEQLSCRSWLETKAGTERIQKAAKLY